MKLSIAMAVGVGVALLLALDIMFVGSFWHTHTAPAGAPAGPSAAPPTGDPAAKATSIALENRRRGASGWSPLHATATAHSVDAYSSEVSVLPGETLHLHVGTRPAASYRVDVYRLGWYGGSGGRAVDCSACGQRKHGAVRPIPLPDPSTGMIRADWPATDAIELPQDSTSGYYVARVTLTSGPQRRNSVVVPFIVRAPPGEHSLILVQASVNTWQAYNNWGGKSLYSFNSTNHAAANHVSFDRPYGVTRVPLEYEYPLVRFLEREHYDVSYTTDVDTDQVPKSLLGHRLVIVNGHDEYWSKGMRDALEHARDAGVNLAFVGADIGDWQIRFQDRGRTIVEYRSAQLDPEPTQAVKTTLFSLLVPPRPQCRVLGIQYQGALASPGDPPRSFTVGSTALGDPWLSGAGFVRGSTLFALVGPEWDGFLAGCVGKATILFHYGGVPNADAVRYIAESGARVFSTGSLQFVRGLDNWLDSYYGEPEPPDPRLQQFMRNALADMTSAKKLTGSKGRYVIDTGASTATNETVIPPVTTLPVER